MFSLVIKNAGRMVFYLSILIFCSCSDDVKRGEIYYFVNPENEAVFDSGEIITPVLNNKNGLLKIEYFLGDSSIFKTTDRDEVFEWYTGIIDSGTVRLRLQVNYVGKKTAEDEIQLHIKYKNKAPVSKINALLRVATTLTDVPFDSRNCYDPDGNDSIPVGIRYDWENDGKWDTEKLDPGIYRNRFKVPGLYSIRSEIMDQKELAVYDTFKIKIVDSKLYVPKMIRVDGGNFQMGRHSDRKKNTYKMQLSNYLIGKYEVTHRQFIDFLNSCNIQKDGIYKNYELIDIDDSDCQIKYDGDKFYFKPSDIARNDKTPVIEISWIGSALYCNWLSVMLGMEPAYNISDLDSIYQVKESNGYRLPSEAEWEYAAWGGRKSKGYTFSGSNSIGTVAWYIINSGLVIHSIGTKKKNELGLYNMSGNVAEWCWDYYFDYPGDTTITDPKGPAKTKTRVIRGGSIGSGSKDCQVKTRNRGKEKSAVGYVGFRIAKSLH